MTTFFAPPTVSRPAEAAPDFAALGQLTGAHDAGYERLKLERTRAIYGAFYQRFQDLLHLDDEGYEVSITLRSPSGKQLTLTRAEAEVCFNLADVYGAVGRRLDALSAEIFDLLAGADQVGALSPFAGTDCPLLAQAHALCLPQSAPAGHQQAA